MTKPTYREQYDKVTIAYIANKVNPFNPCECGIGNLLNNTGIWFSGRGELGSAATSHFARKIASNSIIEQSGGLYSLYDIIELEGIFMKGLRKDEYTEDQLFTNFCKFLDRLEQIHREKGEVIDEVPEFEKRKPQTA